MSRLRFKLYSTLNTAKYSIFYDPNIQIRIRRDSKLKHFIKTILMPILMLRNYFMVDGFIKREIGRLIKKHIKSNTIFLDIGCGNMSLRQFLPKSVCYNAFDIELSEFHLERILSEEKGIKVVLCSATRIPLDSNTVSLIASTEVFDHISDIDKAVIEIYRVLKPGGILTLSISNNYCYKYQKKGPHPEHVNSWTFDEFKEYMKRLGFKNLEGYMMGYWIPLPLWFTKKSYQLPFSSKEEFYNTNFFFVFQKQNNLKYFYY